MRVARLSELFGLDLRSLAALRIGTAGLLLLDLWTRSRDLVAHYSDDGVLPRSALFELASNDWFWSIHTWSGAWQFQALLFAIAAVFAILLLLGYRTRLATVVSWCLLISLQNRNTMILEGADVLLRLILFWGMFLPWGVRCSLDRLARQDNAADADQVCNPATFAYTVQMVLVYFFSAMLKSGDAWHVDGSALYLALSYDITVTSFGRRLLEWPREWLESMTFAAWWLEAVGMFFLFVPLYNALFRVAVIAAFVGLHVGIWASMSIGLFPLIGATAMVAFVPGIVWDLLGRLRVSKAVVHACSLMGQRLRQRLPALPSGGPIATRQSLTGRLVALFFLGYIVVWNLGTLENPIIGTRSMYWIGMLTRTDQNWNMFAPYPALEDGWYVIEGTLEDGSVIDLSRYAMDGSTRPVVNWKKPATISSTFPTSRWQKYMSRLWLRRDRAHRLFFARYICSRWQAEHSSGPRLEGLRIDYMLEVTQRYARPTVVKTHLYRHDCSH